MKKLVYLTLLGVVGAITISIFSNAVVRKDGTEPGYTGSPGDSLKNCTACHGGTAIPVDGWLYATIPAEGYEPGKTYTITAVNREMGATRFGFEASPQAEDGKMLGKIIITDSLRTQLVGDGKYITYTANGVDGIDSMAWSFDWVAPEKGTGEVTIYAAFNSNFEGHKDGDKTYLSLFTTPEKTSTSIAGNSKNSFSFSVFPNPSTTVLSIHTTLQEQASSELEIFDLNGKQSSSFIQKNIPAGQYEFTIPTDRLANGNYLLRIKANGRTAQQKFIVNR